MCKELCFNHQSLDFSPFSEQIIHAVCSKKDLVSNKKQDSFASSVGVRNRELASESLQIKHL
jgi:hypothetical protein